MSSFLSAWSLGYSLVRQLVLLRVDYDARVARLLGESSAAAEGAREASELVRRGLLAAGCEHVVLGAALGRTAAGTGRGAVGPRVGVRGVEQVRGVRERGFVHELRGVQPPAGVAVVVGGRRRLRGGAVLGLLHAAACRAAPGLGGGLGHRHLVTAPHLLRRQQQLLGLRVAATDGQSSLPLRDGPRTADLPASQNLLLFLAKVPLRVPFYNFEGEARLSNA